MNDSAFEELLNIPEIQHVHIDATDVLINCGFTPSAKDWEKLFLRRVSRDRYEARKNPTSYFRMMYGHYPVDLYHNGQYYEDRTKLIAVITYDMNELRKQLRTAGKKIYDCLAADKRLYEELCTKIRLAKQKKEYIYDCDRTVRHIEEEIYELKKYIDANPAKSHRKRDIRIESLRQRISKTEQKKTELQDSFRHYFSKAMEKRLDIENNRTEMKRVEEETDTVCEKLIYYMKMQHYYLHFKRIRDSIDNEIDRDTSIQVVMSPFQHLPMQDSHLVDKDRVVFCIKASACLLYATAEARANANRPIIHKQDNEAICGGSTVYFDFVRSIALDNLYKFWYGYLDRQWYAPGSPYYYGRRIREVRMCEGEIYVEVERQCKQINSDLAFCCSVCMSDMMCNWDLVQMSTLTDTDDGSRYEMPRGVTLWTPEMQELPFTLTQEFLETIPVYRCRVLKEGNEDDAY